MKIVLLAKAKSNSIEVITFKTLTDSYISHDEFALVNDTLKESKIERLQQRF